MAGENNITGILNKYGAEISAELKDFILQKPLTVYGVVNASGKLKNSVRYDIKDSVMRVYALNYIYWVEHGRKPGKRPPFDSSSTKYGVKERGESKGQPRGDFPSLSEWMENKPSAQSRFGWSLLTQAKKASLIYMIATKMKKEGTVIYKQGGTKLLEDILTAELKGDIQSDLILTLKAKTNALMRSAITGK